MQIVNGFVGRKLNAIAIRQKCDRRVFSCGRTTIAPVLMIWLLVKATLGYMQTFRNAEVIPK
jgi:hypothetical protein